MTDDDSATEYAARWGPLTARQAVAAALAIIARQSNLRDEQGWADAFHEIALVLDRVPTGEV